MRPGIAITLALVPLCTTNALGADDGTVQLDPFARATAGYERCPETAPPTLSAEQARAQAHARAERGTRCAMEGTCEPGGAYRRDPELNERVAAAIAGDRRFATTSVWVTTSRKWVTLQGCVRSKRQRGELVAMVRTLPNVERVFDETIVGTTPRPHK